MPWLLCILHFTCCSTSTAQNSSFRPRLATRRFLPRLDLRGPWPAPMLAWRTHAHQSERHLTVERPLTVDRIRPAPTSQHLAHLECIERQASATGLRKKHLEYVYVPRVVLGQGPRIPGTRSAAGLEQIEELLRKEGLPHRREVQAVCARASGVKAAVSE